MDEKPMLRTDGDAILCKKFFSATMDEIKALTPGDRHELAVAIRETLPTEVPALVEA